MKVRKLDPVEHGKTRLLYEEVFTEDSPAFVDYYYREKAKDNQIYVTEEDGQIRGMLHLNPYRLWVNGSEKEAHYIVAVATQKEYRGKGIMTALLKQSLRALYQAGETFTFLMPVSERIYLPFEFRTVYEQEPKSFQLAEVPGCVIQNARLKDCEELAVFANRRLSERYQVFALRDETYYRRLLMEYESDGGCLKLYRENGQIADCKGWYPELDKERPKIMARITDVRRMLMSLSLDSLMCACFCITDPVIEENNRCVVITGTEFSGVMLMEGKPENSEGTITVAALASLVFGAKTVEEVCLEEGTWMSERMKGEMEKMIPLSKIYLNETV